MEKFPEYNHTAEMAARRAAIGTPCRVCGQPLDDPSGSIRGGYRCSKCYNAACIATQAEFDRKIQAGISDFEAEYIAEGL